MADFREVAVVRLMGLGGELDTRYATGRTQEHIKAALYELIANAVIEEGDTIQIDVVETEYI